MTIGLLHPGEMGAAVGAVLRERGQDVVWASVGRSESTARRAEAAGLVDVQTAAELARSSDVILSICPPHAALDVARAVAGFAGVYVDANAVSPATAREVGAIVSTGGATFVDGGIVGGPPSDTHTTHLYVSGGEADAVTALFAGTQVAARVVSAEIGSASALKMVYAAWSKGTAALLLAIRAVARAEGVEEALVREWEASVPELPDRARHAARAAATKGWRWIGEMEEIAATFAAAGLPDGFHAASADVFRRSPRLETVPADDATLEAVLAALVSVDGDGELEPAALDPRLDEPAHPPDERP